MASVAIRIFMIFVLWTTLSFADDSIERFEDVTPRPHEFGESALYVGILYGASLPVYLLISNKEVFNNATLQNYFRNFGNITFFDQDLPGANWGMHLATGSVVYEFYRARSYSLTDAFLMTLIQECLFQFTVETLIQPTALENVAATAIVGSILGRGLEVASIPMLNSDFFLFRFLGHVLNLPTVFGLWESKTKITPIIEKSTVGASLRMEL